MQRIVRRWAVNRPGNERVHVSTVHAQHGLLPRGTIRLAGSEAGRCRWQATDHDGFALDPIVGDYVNAEAALLAATAALDEPTPENDDSDPWRLP